MNSNKQYYLQLLRKHIIRSSKWKTGSQWQQSDFSTLADKIEQLTHEPISISTLKRMWKSDTYIPRIGTLDILARYAGYAGWHHFIEQHHTEASGRKATERVSGNTRSKRGYRMGIAWLVILLSIGLVFWKVFFESKSIEEFPVHFATDVTVKDGVPTTIVFNYQVPELSNDSFHIQLSWNSLERTRVFPHNQYLTTTYYYPGLHRSKLLHNGAIIREGNVYITSPDWVALYRYSPTDRVPHYLPLAEVRNKGELSASMSLLKKHGARINEDIYTSFIYSNEALRINTDAMFLEARIRNTSINHTTICGESWLYLYADSGDVAIPLVNKGCEGNASIRFGDKYIDGKTQTLTGFGQTMSSYQKFGLEVINNRVNCRVGDSVIYTFTYDSRLGNLRALQFFFHGAGAVDYCHIKNKDSAIGNQFDF